MLRALTGRRATSSSSSQQGQEQHQQVPELQEQVDNGIATNWSFDVEGKVLTYRLDVQWNNSKTLKIHGDVPRPFVSYKEAKVRIGSDNCKAEPGNVLKLTAVLPSQAPSEWERRSGQLSVGSVENLTICFSQDGRQILESGSRFQRQHEGPIGLSGELQSEETRLVRADSSSARTPELQHAMPLQGTRSAPRVMAPASGPPPAPAAPPPPPPPARAPPSGTTRRAEVTEARAFPMSAYRQYPRVVKIKVWSGNLIDAIEFIMSNGCRKRYPEHGTPHGGRLNSVFELEPHEKLVRIRQRAGDYLDWVEFVLDSGRRVEFGNRTGGEPLADLTAPRGGPRDTPYDVADHIFCLHRKSRGRRGIRTDWCARIHSINDPRLDVYGYWRHYALQDAARDNVAALDEARVFDPDGGGSGVDQDSPRETNDYVVCFSDDDERERLRQMVEDEPYTDQQVRSQLAVVSEPFSSSDEDSDSSGPPIQTAPDAEHEDSSDVDSGSEAAAPDESDLIDLPPELPVEMQIRLCDIDSCPICFEEFAEGEMEKCVTSECGHAYCRQCAMNVCRMEAPRYTGRCAVCRERFSLRNMFCVSTSKTDNGGQGLALVRCFEALAVEGYEHRNRERRAVTSGGIRGGGSRGHRRVTRSGARRRAANRRAAAADDSSEVADSSEIVSDPEDTTGSDRRTPVGNNPLAALLQPLQAMAGVFSLANEVIREVAAPGPSMGTHRNADGITDSDADETGELSNASMGYPAASRRRSRASTGRNLQGRGSGARRAPTTTPGPDAHFEHVD